MIVVSDGKRPRIEPSAQIASSAVISGDVSIGRETRIAHGAVLVSEGGPIHIGTQCLVMENAVIRGVPGQVTTLGERVLVGPHSHLVGCRIGDDVFLATAATVFNGAIVGERSEVRIRGVVHLRTTLPADSTVPIGWVAVGTPAIIRAPGDHDEIWAVQQSLDFPGYVFGMDRPPPGGSLMPALMPRYLSALRRMHADDSPTAS